MEPTQPKPHQLAIWNQEKDLWETGVEDIFGHSDVYSETWPTSGMTANGVAYALQMWERHTPGSESSYSPPGETPLLKTPTSQLAINGGSQHPDKRKAVGHGPTLADEVEHLLPTPVAQPSGNTPEDHLRKKPGRERVTDLAILTENGLIETGGKLLPTHTVGMTQGGSRTRSGQRNGELLLPGVAESIGAPTSLLSAAGKPCEEPPLPLPS